MKLDRGTICSDILVKALDVSRRTMKPEDFWRWLTEIDLVFKPGDASQGILVENKPENTEIDWIEVYKQEK